MKEFISELFNIKRGEWRKFIFLYLSYFLLIGGMSIGEIISESLFLNRFGVSVLPKMYILSAIITFIASFIYASFTDKVRSSRMLMILCLISASAIISIRFFISETETVVSKTFSYFSIYTILYILVKVLVSVLVTHIWIYIADFYNTMDAKRIFPIVATAGRLGEIFFGLTLSYIIKIKIIQYENALLGWSIFLIISAFLAFIIDKKISHIQFGQSSYSEAKEIDESEDKKKNYINDMVSGFKYVISSPYLQVLALSMFITAILLSFLDYQFNRVFVAKFPTKNELGAFYGQFRGYSNIIALLIQLFLTTRLVAWLGVGNSNFIFPVTTLLSFIGLNVSYTFVPAVFAKFNHSGFRESIRNPINNMLYNAIPDKMRGKARAFIAGSVSPFATCVAGGFLLWFINLFPAPNQLSTFGIFLSIIFIIVAYLQKREYTKSLVDMLEGRNFDLYRLASDGYGKVDDKLFYSLVHNLKQDDDEISIMSAQILAETAKERAIEPIMSVLSSKSDKVQYALLEILGDIGIGNEALRKVCEERLKDEDPRVRAMAVKTLGKLIPPDEIVDEIAEMLFDSDSKVRGNAIVIILRSGDLFGIASAIQTLNEMLQSKNPDMRAVGVHTIGKIGDKRFIKTLLPFIEDKNPKVKISTVRAINELCPNDIDDKDNKIFNYMIQALKDKEIEVIIPAIKVLGKIKNKSAISHLMELPEISVSKVKQEVISAIESIGEPALDYIEPYLSSPKAYIRETAITVYARIAKNSNLLNRMNEKLQKLIEYEVKNVYINLAHLYSLKSAPNQRAVEILAKAIEDENRFSTSNILKLLGVIGNEKAVNIIIKSLKINDNRLRANAMEALENVTARNLALLIQPLLYNPDLESKLEIGRSKWEIPKFTLWDTLNEYLYNYDGWTRASTVYAIGRLCMNNNLPNKNKDEIVQLIAGTVDDEDPFVRESAMDALGKLDEQSDFVRDVITRTSQTDSNMMVKQQAVQSLIEISYKRGEIEKIEGGFTMLSTIEKAIFLKRVPTFEGLTTEQLKIVSNICTEYNPPSGRVIFKENEIGDSLYIVVDGKIDIIKDYDTPKSRKLATLESHNYFGEMAIFDDEPRSATAVVLEEARLLVIKKDNLKELILNYPDISFEIIKVLSRRLRETNLKIQNQQITDKENKK